MNKNKTGQLIAKRRREMGMTQDELSKLLYVAPSTVSTWENGRRYPDGPSQVMIEKVMDLNPIELLSGVKMYDEKLKKEISAYMAMIDKEVCTGGIVTDEDGNESYLDMSEYMIVTNNENGEASDRWIPYLEYYNEKPHVMTEREKKLKAIEDAVPKTEYDPMKVYINCNSAIFVISREKLEAIGKPRFFDIGQNEEEGWVGIQFGDSGTFDIPDEVYGGHGNQGEIHGNHGPCLGLMINGGEFGAELCRQMRISRLFDKMEVEPEFYEKHNMLVLDLHKAKRVKVKIDLNYFALPTWQFEEELRILEEEEEEERQILEEEESEDE